MIFAGPVLSLGAFLIVWAAMAARPDHPVTRAFYWRFRPLTVRAPRPALVTAATALGIAEIGLAGVLAVVRPDPIGGAVLALGSVAVIVVVLALSLLA